VLRCTGTLKAIISAEGEPTMVAHANAAHFMAFGAGTIIL
jgi:hypothetical protein